MHPAKLIPPVLATTVLASCTFIHGNSANHLDKVDYGQYPSSYARIITDYMTDYLLDPQSAVYTNWKGPAKGFLTNGTGVFYGYRVCVDINTKNKYGTYTGTKQHLFMIVNNRVVMIEGGHRNGTTEHDQVFNMCSTL